MTVRGGFWVPITIGLCWLLRSHSHSVKPGCSAQGLKPSTARDTVKANAISLRYLTSQKVLTNALHEYGSETKHVLTVLYRQSRVSIHHPSTCVTCGSGRTLEVRNNQCSKECYLKTYKLTTKAACCKDKMAMQVIARGGEFSLFLSSFRRLNPSILR